jgi:DNA-binding response OmpR family regulator
MLANKNKLIPSQKRIIVLESPVLREYALSLKLEHLGYMVFSADNSTQALDLLKLLGLPHLAVVDLDLPDANKFCNNLKQFSDVPIILLVDNNPNHERVVSKKFEYLVDEVAVKPLKPLELIANVQRVLQKFGNYGYPLSAYIKINHNLSVNFAQQLLYKNEQIIPLSAIECKILHILMREAGHIVIANCLLKRLQLDNTQQLDSIIAKLALKLELNDTRQHPECPLEQQWIGYRFATKEEMTVQV